MDSGRKRGTDLNTESSLDLDLSLVVLPANSELDDSLRDLDNLERLLVLWLLFKELCMQKRREASAVIHPRHALFVPLQGSERVHPT